MKRQNHKEMLSDLVNNSISPEEEKELIAHLIKSGVSPEEIESFLTINRLMEESESAEPTERMDKIFYAMIEDEKRKNLIGEQDTEMKRSSLFSIILPGLRIAAGITLFLLGWFASGWLGNSGTSSGQITNLTGEVKQLKETLVLTMMQQSSPIERVKAVNMVDDFESVDNQMIKSLIGVLNNDSNDNVRLLALDALVKYSSNPLVRNNLVQSISLQTSPMLQYRLAQIMLSLKEKRAVPEFQKMLQSTNLNYSVRGKMEEVVSVLL